ncbi:hypothetical protein GOP47_0020781 [Adiantum capillus-veneris]|uniref:Uncharacterized protein n=1 Tax=Adiantum capillus-veneris TaxID=13818 RepID=A0A9D4UBP7_ADICA|nr:hypothetical protein GOP47_0020781 [Adiantum capillus-veneris]
MDILVWILMRKRKINTSDSVVVSSQGKLVGIHFETITQSTMIFIMEHHHLLMIWRYIKDLARHAVYNMGEKGMIGSFLQVKYLKLKLMNEGISNQSTKHHRKVIVATQTVTIELSM